MEENSVGSPVSLLLLSQLTPKSQRTYFSVLNREIECVINTNSEDDELCKEAEALSQSIKNLVYKDSSKKDNQNKLAGYKKTVHKFTNADLGPYLVMVESTSSENIGNIHPMNLGKKLINNGIKGVKNIMKKGKKRVGIEFYSGLAANTFVMSNFFNNKDYSVFIPTRLVTCRGVIRNIGSDISEEDILNKSDSKVKIKSARPFKKRTKVGDKVEYINSTTWLITFEGKILPEAIAICSCRAQISLYIPPVIQCYKCLRYGHIELNCRGNKRCRNCGHDHSENECENIDKPSCVHCEDGHASTDRSCPEYSRQKRINELIAVENISYFEAVKQVEKNYMGPQEQPQMYPSLPQSKTNSEKITLINVADRRILQNTKTKPTSSYATVTKKENQLLNTFPTMTKRNIKIK